MPLGSSCIRYDIFGPAFTIASALAATCERDKVHVEERLCQAAEEQEHFATFTDIVLAGEEESNERKTLLGDTKQSQQVGGGGAMNQHLPIVGGPRSNLGDQTMANRSLSACSTRIVGFIINHKQAKFVSAVPRATDSFSLPAEDERRKDNLQNNPESSLLQFDPIGAINATHPFDNDDRMSVVQASGSAKVTISTGEARRSVEVKKTWCTFVSEFCDPKVQEEAMQQVREDSIFSFFLVNVFMAVFLFICCLSVVEERVARYADDAAALSVYFVVTGLAAIVVFPLLAFFVWKAHTGNTRCRTANEKSV